LGSPGGCFSLDCSIVVMWSCVICGEDTEEKEMTDNFVRVFMCWEDSCCEEFHKEEKEEWECVVCWRDMEWFWSACDYCMVWG